MVAADPDTIFALSSGPLPAAIAVVRVSGPAAGKALTELAGTLPPPRRATVAVLRHGGELLDRALVLWLPGPGSATGEDLAELHLHGGRAVAAAVLAALGTIAGLRPAEPGEFTRRAFRNGRLDLAQAEGLADLLAAETEAQRRQAIRQAEGGLGRLVEQWRKSLLACAAAVEVAIDYADEGETDGMAGTASVAVSITELADAMQSALQVPPAERLLDGVRIVFAGPVNSGKSSLVNTLAGREAAIASPVAGTTRDLIEVPVVIAGMPCLLIDSAGLRTSDDPVERIGIDRAEAALATADLIVWLGPPDDRPGRLSDVIIVHPKADLQSTPPAGINLAVSTLSGEGIRQLRAVLEQRVTGLLPPSDRLALNARQHRLVREAHGAVRAAAAEKDALLSAEHLRSARSALDALTGRAGVEDMLDQMFGRFCLGK